jgi:hypothetical protein
MTHSENQRNFKDLDKKLQNIQKVIQKEKNTTAGLIKATRNEI